MQTIGHERLEAMKNENADFTLVEVLNKKSFDDYHIPGAINVPLGKDFDDKIQETVPDKEKAVVLYCKDTECDASPKAAKKMEQLGYTKIYDLQEGKVGWKDAGYPVE